MDYLKDEIITYIGNKRKLLDLINEAIDAIPDDIHSAVDLFSGSGVVARMFKEKGFDVIANDFEPYSAITNECFLSNADEFDIDTFNAIKEKILSYPPQEGIFCANYAPQDTHDIKEGERAFIQERTLSLLIPLERLLMKYVQRAIKSFSTDQ